MSLFFFMRRFWNHILTCWSLRFRRSESSLRRCLVMNSLSMNSPSSSASWSLEYGLRFFRVRVCIGYHGAPGGGIQRISHSSCTIHGHLQGYTPFGGTSCEQSASHLACCDLYVGSPHDEGLCRWAYFYKFSLHPIVCLYIIRPPIYSALCHMKFYCCSKATLTR